MKGKVIIISAPSGTGKSTIINRILKDGDIDLKFSVSATNRSPREGEVNGVHYHFLTTELFRQKIAENAFVEFEEVYSGRYYGTLRSEIENICISGHNCILDIDVKGALNVKRIFGSEAVSIFIMPPSVAALQERLEGRGTDDASEIARRIGKAELEMSYAPEFDHTVINDNLDHAVKEVSDTINAFIHA